MVSTEAWRELALGQALRRWKHKIRSARGSITRLRYIASNAAALDRFETLRKVGYVEEHKMALRRVRTASSLPSAGLSRALLRWVQNTLERSEMVQRTRALVQQHLTNKYTRLAWQEWLAIYQTTRSKLHILWSFNRGVNHVQRAFKRA